MIRPERVGLILVLLVYAGLACAYAWFTPPWNNPDEPAHYNYVAYVAERHALPELVPGDWDQDLLSQAIPERFHPRFDVSTIRYESHQPPLYYLLAAPVYSATSGASLRTRVLALRAVSIGLGILFGLMVFQLAREVASQPGAAVLATATALLIPMSTAGAASINNDMLAMLLAASTTLVLVRWTRWWSKPSTIGRNAPSVGLAVLLGVLVGLLLLTKLTVYVFVLLAAAVVLVALVRQTQSTIRFRHASRLALTALVSLSVSGWWFIRSASIYGWTDVLAQHRHDAVVIGQPRYANFGFDNWVYLVVTAFHSFFAQFGWMTIVVDNLTYGLYGALVVFALYGFWASRSIGNGRPVLVLCLSVVLVVGQLFYYNVSFIQAQGRYLFPALGSIAVILSIGWTNMPGHVMRAAIAVLWSSLALAVSIGGIGDWDIGPRSITAFVLITAGLTFGFVRISRSLTAGAIENPRARWDLTGITIVGLAALNLTCLLRYVLPFYRG